MHVTAPCRSPKTGSCRQLTGSTATHRTTDQQGYGCSVAGTGNQEEQHHRHPARPRCEGRHRHLHTLQKVDNTTQFVDTATQNVENATQNTYNATQTADTASRNTNSGTQHVGNERRATPMQRRTSTLQRRMTGTTTQDDDNVTHHVNTTRNTYRRS